MANVTVTCETGGCVNAGIGIPIDTGETDPAEAQFICGVCGLPIQSVVTES